MATYNPKTGLYERDADSKVFVRDRRPKKPKPTQRFSRTNQPEKRK